MSAPIVKGWCPGALRPMMSGDGLVVRIRPPHGGLSQEQALAVAAASLKFGNGLIDLSSRANLQLRGVSERSHPELIENLQSLGLVDSDPMVEARRNITISPFANKGDDCWTIARDLQVALANPSAPQTPGKFGFAVDCGPVPVLAHTSADIRIERLPDGRLIVRPDGTHLGAIVTTQTATPMALKLADWFLTSGGASGNRGRMARHITTGAKLPAEFHHTLPLPERFKAAPGLTDLGFMVACEFGQISAEQLTKIAKMGPLRLTPWRMVLVEECTVPIEIDGIITAPDDARLRVSACTGAPGCPQANSPIRATARAIASDVAPGETLHISACSKGCAHPHRADKTLVATQTHTFNLIRNGLASDQPDITGLTLSDLSEHIKTRGI